MPNGYPVAQGNLFQRGQLGVFRRLPQVDKRHRHIYRRRVDAVRVQICLRFRFQCRRGDRFVVLKIAGKVPDQHTVGNAGGVLDGGFQRQGGGGVERAEVAQGGLAGGEDAGWVRCELEGFSGFLDEGGEVFGSL